MWLMHACALTLRPNRASRRRTGMRLLADSGLPAWPGKKLVCLFQLLLLLQLAVAQRLVRLLLLLLL